MTQTQLVVPPAPSWIGRTDSQAIGLPGNLIQIHPLRLDQGLLELGDGRVTLGRGDSCVVQIHEDCVSRTHAVIDRDPILGYSIRDLGSTNGTWVNEKPIDSHGLRPGDRIRVGTHIFKFVCANDIEAQYHETVYSMMTRDGLTGTFNQRSFLEMTEQEIKRAQRSGRGLSLILFDIDHFKVINDTHGHLAGDDVLKELCRRLGPEVPEGDLFARYGGEEFAILLTDSSKTAAIRLAEHCRRKVEATPFATCAGELCVTISSGVASSSLDAERFADSQAFFQRADQRLYQAKRSGRNRVSA